MLTPQCIICEIDEIYWTIHILFEVLVLSQIKTLENVKKKKIQITCHEKKNSSTNFKILSRGWSKQRKSYRCPLFLIFKGNNRFVISKRIQSLLKWGIYNFFNLKLKKKQN